MKTAKDPYPSPDFTKGEYATLTVEGDSLAPRIPGGAKLLLRTYPTAAPDETVVAWCRGCLATGKAKKFPPGKARVYGVLESFTVTAPDGLIFVRQRAQVA